MHVRLQCAIGFMIFMSRLVFRNVTMSESTSIETRNSETDWIQFPHAELYGTSYSENRGEKIRDLFSDSDSTITGDIIEYRSPTLELAFGDTGDKSFLEKDTIKHSISDMASLSKTSRLLGDKLLSCNAIQEGPKLYFPICPGDVVVTTIAGAMKMTCNEIEKRIFYGPITIKSINCQQSFVFDIDCSQKEALRISSTSYNDSHYQLAFIAMSVMFSLSILILFIMISWYFGMERGVIVGGKKLRMVRNGKFYEAYYHIFTNGEGKKEIILDKEPSVVNMETKVIRKHWFKLLLLFIIFRPINVASYELIETYDSTILKYNYKILMSDSENINFGSGSIRREVVVHTSNLAYLFDTTQWKLDTKEEYFCQWHKCEAISICGIGVLPFIKTGDLANELFGFKNNSRSYYTCQKLQGYCTFGNGCKLIAFEIIPSGNDVFSVYTMSSGGSHGGSITPPVGCIVDDVKDKSEGLLLDYLLLINKHNKAYLCHSEMFSRKPEMGMLGDLQITSDGRYHFATNEVKCVADYGDRALRRYSEPFLNRVDSLCEDTTTTLPYRFRVQVVTLAVFKNCQKSEQNSKQ